jgi:hypothetical protein
MYKQIENAVSVQLGTTLRVELLSFEGVDTVTEETMQGRGNAVI